MRFIFAATFVLSLVPSVARAAEGTPQCLEGARFTVAFQERADRVGSTIIAHPRPVEDVSACTLARTEESFAVGGADDAFYVRGLAGDILVLDAGTGPERRLVLYDLARRDVIFSTAYDPAEPVTLAPDAISFWEVDNGATPANCPEYQGYRTNGLSAALSRPVRLRLPALTREITGAPRCVARQ